MVVMYNKIIESCNYVMDNSYYVNINYNKLDKFISKINTKDLKNWLLNNPYNLLELDMK